MVTMHKHTKRELRRCRDPKCRARLNEQQRAEYRRHRERIKPRTMPPTFIRLARDCGIIFNWSSNA